MKHIPVLLKEVLFYLSIRAGGVYFDGTGGYAGYSLEILKRLEPSGKLITIDLDPEAVKIIKERSKDYNNITVLKNNFADILEAMRETGIDGFDGVVLDLGLSSLALDNPARGFAHRLNGPLDLRFDQESDIPSAADLIRNTEAEEIATILRKYGEIRNSAKIARAIKSVSPTTTEELAGIVGKFTDHAHREKLLSQVFQALRIEVNRELENLQNFLRNLPYCLKPGGRAVIVSFHSLEDRLTKDFFKVEAADCVCPVDFPICVCDHKARFKMITGKAVKPTQEEIAVNPRSRSAKLRCGERV